MRAHPHRWPAGVTRVPYWLYEDREIAAREQTEIFEGPVWNFLCLEAELPRGVSPAFDGLTIRIDES